MTAAIIIGLLTLAVIGLVILHVYDETEGVDFEERQSAMRAAWHDFIDQHGRVPSIDELLNQAYPEEGE